MHREKVREKSREGHNHKPQPFLDIKRKPTNPNKRKLIKHTKNTKISFPKRGNRSTKRTEKHNNKMAQGKAYNNLPRRINHKAPKSKTNTGTIALEQSVANLYLPISQMSMYDHHFSNLDRPPVLDDLCKD